MPVYRTYSKKATPQRQPIPGRTDQTPNEEGGYTFPITNWDRLGRFLILGSDAGFYCDGAELTKQNAEAVIACVKENGTEVVRRIVDVSQRGLAADTDPAIFALAICLSEGDTSTKRQAADAVPSVCRIGTHILHLANFADGLRGWGPVLRRAIKSWFLADSPRDSAYQAVKYQARDGWSLADLLRKSHPIPKDATRSAVFKWIVDGVLPFQGPDMMYDLTAVGSIIGYTELRREPPEVAANVIRIHRLPREAVDTELLKRPDVWAALLDDMPITALIRNLATLTRNGIFDDPEMVSSVTARLTDRERLRRGRVHPLAVYLGLRTYNVGHGFRSKQEWAPVQAIGDALELAFDRTFEYLPQSDKTVHVTVDVSGSMSAQVRNSPLTAREAAGAMAYILSKVYPNADFSAFDTDVMVVPRENLDTLKSTLQCFSHAGGGTDCSVTIQALRAKVDGLVMLTDSQTWAGGIYETRGQHPCQAMESYRKQYNKEARLVIAETTAYRNTIADPQDRLSLGCAGFSADLPGVVVKFLEGELNNLTAAAS